MSRQMSWPQVAESEDDKEIVSHHFAPQQQQRTLRIDSGGISYFIDQSSINVDLRLSYIYTYVSRSSFKGRMDESTAC